ncbi:hypothetical protein ACN47E_005974 [Coniothyrium glycines]
MPAESRNGEQEREVSPSAETRGDNSEGEDALRGADMTSHAAPADELAPEERDGAETTPDPPLPDEDAPPLPDEPPPNDADDGWDAKWDYNASAWYFYNKRTGKSQWENPRVPEATTQPHGSYDRNAHSGAPGLAATSGVPGSGSGSGSPPRRRWGGYNPAIHGSYDPNADYAQEASREEEEEEEEFAAAASVGHATVPGQEYAAAAHFNRFTGKFQQAEMGPEMHNDENKSKRQMSAFFDVDAAANSHDGRSLKAERRGKTLSKKELKAFKEKRRDKKEEKRRAWLRD